MEKRFSSENLKIATAIENFFKLILEECKFFVDLYQVILMLLKFTLMIFMVLFTYILEFFKCINTKFEKIYWE